MTLTRRQEEIMQLIYDHWFENGYSISIREISIFTGMKSLNGVKEQLEKLKSKGLAEWTKGQCRTLRLTNAGYDFIESSGRAVVGGQP